MLMSLNAYLRFVTQIPVDAQSAGFQFFILFCCCSTFRFLVLWQLIILASVSQTHPKLFILFIFLQSTGFELLISNEHLDGMKQKYRETHKQLGCGTVEFACSPSLLS